MWKQNQGESDAVLGVTTASMRLALCECEEAGESVQGHLTHLQFLAITIKRILQYIKFMHM